MSLKKIVILFIGFYQKYLSFDRGVLMIFAPGGACKYSPTCSEYMKECIVQFGLIEGMKKGLIRLWSCR